VIHALSLTAGQRVVTIHSNTPGVTDWATRYFGQYWSTSPLAGSAAVPGPVVTVMDGDHRAPVAVSPHTQHAVFAREPIGYTRHPDGTVTAHTLSEPLLAFHYVPTEAHLRISSPQALRTAASPDRPTRLATAATRFAREMMRARLIADGWVLLHASAVVFPGGHTLLTLGDSGAGKTTTALTLASAGAALLANDCCFARPNAEGNLDLLPWPAASAVGLGLLHALTFTDSARSHLQAGQPPHPTQDQRVTDALTAGRAGAVMSASGRELKAHIWPEQLTRWFGLSLATTGTAAGVLLPHVTSSPGVPAHVNDDRPSDVTTRVFVASEEERYPDLFGFTEGSNTGSATARTKVLQHLNRLPRRAVDLSHDQAANTRLLTALTTSLVDVGDRLESGGRPKRQQPAPPAAPSPGPSQRGADGRDDPGPGSPDGAHVSARLNAEPPFAPAFRVGALPMAEPGTPAIRTSAKAVIVHDGRVLLQKANWDGRDVHFLPGGGQNPGEPLDRTAVREVLEETGLTVRVERLLWLREYIGLNHESATEADTHRVEAIFLCTPISDPNRLGGHLHDDLQTGLEWLPLDKAADPTTDLLPSAVRELLPQLTSDTPHPGDPYLGDTA